MQPGIELMLDLLGFADRLSGDGVVAALKVLSVMVEEGKPLSELARCMERAPQVLINIKVGKKRPLEELPEVQKLIIARELLKEPS